MEQVIERKAQPEGAELRPGGFDVHERVKNPAVIGGADANFHLVGSAQLPVLLLQQSHPGPLIVGEPGPFGGIGLSSANPDPQRTLTNLDRIPANPLLS